MRIERCGFRSNLLTANLVANNSPTTTMKFYLIRNCLANSIKVSYPV